MKGKSKLIALIVMLVLMMQMTGCGEAADSDSENENTINTWAGYETDAANGLRVKEVRFTTYSGVSTVCYDVEGNITDLLISYSHFDYEPFFEKALGIPVPFKYVFKYDDGDRDLKKRFPDYKLYIKRVFPSGGDSYQLVKNDGTYYLKYLKSSTDNYDYSIRCLEDGRCSEELRYGGRYSCSYDSNGRVTNYIGKPSETSTDSGWEWYTRREYTYEGDSSYLESFYSEDEGGWFEELEEEEEIIITFEYDYDANNNLISVEEYAVTEEGQIYGALVHIWEYEYDENGNVVCETDTVGSDEGDIVTTYRYQYDNDGNMIEECTYETFGSEEYMTHKTDYVYRRNTCVRRARDTDYKYEANADFSIVNLTDTDEGEWYYDYGEFHEGYDEVNDCWTVTYYTQEEVDQYMHDQEFHSVN